MQLATVVVGLCALALANAVPLSGGEKRLKSRYPQFDGLTFEELKKFGGGDFDEKLENRPLAAKRKTSSVALDSLPPSYDVWTDHAPCETIFKDIFHQGKNCSGSWAVAVATSIRDRQCITNGVKSTVSVWDLLTCGMPGGNGCNGGSHYDAFMYYVRSGLVSGDKFHTDGHKSCKPYPIDPEEEEDKMPNTTCVEKCNADYGKDYKDDKTYGSSFKTFTVQNEDVMLELKTNGPLVAKFKLYSDLFEYKEGVYVHSSSATKVGYHYAKIVGWGVDNVGRSYWRAANSWGKDWGESGMFRIARGTNEAGFEADIMAGIVQAC